MTMFAALEAFIQWDPFVAGVAIALGCAPFIVLCAELVVRFKERRGTLRGPFGLTNRITLPPPPPRLPEGWR